MSINKSGRDNAIRPCQMDELAHALAKLRDTCVKLSLLLRDQLTEVASPERDQVIADVEHYLSRFRKIE